MVMKESRESTTTEDLFRAFENLPNILFNSTTEELVQIKGIGQKKAQKLLAVKEIIKRLNAYTWVKDKYKISSPKYVVNLLNDMKYLKQEIFKTILLDTKNQVLQVETISIGTLNASLVHPREVFSEAIEKRSASIIIIHNHPSGNPEPSREDINITKRSVEVGEIIGIKVIDHIIIGDGHYSFKENCLI